KVNGLYLYSTLTSPTTPKCFTLQSVIHTLTVVSYVSSYSCPGRKSRIVSLPQNNVPGPKVVPKPMMLRCSQLGQSCVPLCGCCDLCATCHCRFFNAICFCRKAKSRCGKKARNSRKATKSQRHNPKHTPG
uniref:Agouti domain-containing protein n=1 Tax=Fundulus heteroclitus TaxID=8078 RepID=A0A3Q2PTY0_FUNHE